MGKQYVVTPRGISKPSMTNTDGMENGEVCKLLNKLKKENAEYKRRLEELKEYLEVGKGIYSLIGQAKPFYDALKKMEELSGGKD